MRLLYYLHWQSAYFNQVYPLKLYYCTRVASLLSITIPLVF